MKAVICTKYGPPEVLQIREVEKPSPKPNEVLVKILATTAHIGDTKIRRFEPGLGPVKDFFFKPLMRIIVDFTGQRKKILGMEFSGEIEVLPVGFVIQMQADHVVHHVKRILEIRKEISGT